MHLYPLAAPSHALIDNKNEKKHTKQHNEIPHGRPANTPGNKLLTLPAGVDVESLPSFRPRPGTFINQAVFAGN